MPFATELEARQFLVDKICRQSKSEGLPLSDVERRLLLFSEEEQDRGSKKRIPDEVLNDVDLDWELRMTALLRQAWQRDKDDPIERQQYLDAIERLKPGDHYILVIAGPVFGNPPTAVLPEISLRRIALWIVAGVAVLFVIALLWLWRSR